MSVISLTEKFLKRGGSEDQDKTLVFRVFQILTDNKRDDALVVMAAPNLPQIGDDYPDDSNLWCTRIEPVIEGDDGQIWEVKNTYEPKPDTVPGSPGNNPWDEEPVISFGYTSRQVVLERSYHAVLSSAGDLDEPIPGSEIREDPTVLVENSVAQPFDPPAELQDAILVITIQRNVTQGNFSPVTLQSYQNTVNKNGATGEGGDITVAGIKLAPFTGWIRDYKAQKAWTGNDHTPYWKETIEILVDDKTWLKWIADLGIFERKETGTAGSPSDLLKYVKVLDEDDDPVRDPVKLDGDGHRIGIGEAPVYFLYHALWETDWTALDLPTSY